MAITESAVKNKSYEIVETDDGNIVFRRKGRPNEQCNIKLPEGTTLTLWIPPNRRKYTSFGENEEVHYVHKPNNFCHPQFKFIKSGKGRGVAEFVGAIVHHNTMEELLLPEKPDETSPSIPRTDVLVRDKDSTWA